MNLFFNYNYISPSKTTAAGSLISSLKPSERFYNHQLQQNFSLPDPLIYRITKNLSSAKLYLKMIQTCKYFFIRNQILIATPLESGNHKQTWHTKFNEKHEKSFPCKFWLTEKLGIYNRDGVTEDDKNFVSDLVPKLIHSNIKILDMVNQSMSFDDFIFIATKCEEINLDNVLIMDDNDSHVPLEKVIEVLSQLQKFFFADIHPSAFTPSTVSEMLKIPHFLNLKELSLWEVTDDFDIESFYVNIKKNTKTKIYLIFCNQISEQYGNRLHEIIVEILQTENLH